MRSSMNSDGQHEIEKAEDDRPAKGPNLIVLYCLLGAAMLAAMAVAVLIVLPFYRHR
jgi:hypothetical protein